MKTVYFLGAGATKALHSAFPVAAQLSIDYLLADNGYPDATKPLRVIEDIQTAIQKGRIAKGVAGCRLEVALGLLIERNRQDFDRVVYCLWRRLACPMTLDVRSYLEPFLRAALTRRDAIFTTNYDTMLEWTLASMDSGVRRSAKDAVEISALGWMDDGVKKVRTEPDFDEAAFRLLEKDYRALPLLKLHGSIGWSACLKCDTYNLSRRYNRGVADAMEGTRKCPNGCPPAHQEPVIVPPTSEKSYENPAIQEIWSRAGALLSEASRIVFAGYALDPTDRHVHELVEMSRASGALSEVIVVDPSCNTWLRYRRLFGRIVTPPIRSWTHYLESHFTEARNQG